MNKRESCRFILKNQQDNELKERFIPFEKPIVRESSHRKIRPIKYRRVIKITK